MLIFQTLEFSLPIQLMHLDIEDREEPTKQACSHDNFLEWLGIL